MMLSSLFQNQFYLINKFESTFFLISRTFLLKYRFLLYFKNVSSQKEIWFCFFLLRMKYVTLLTSSDTDRTTNHPQKSWHNRDPKYHGQTWRRAFPGGTSRNPQRLQSIYPKVITHRTRLHCQWQNHRIERHVLLHQNLPCRYKARTVPRWLGSVVSLDPERILRWGPQIPGYTPPNCDRSFHCHLDDVG